MGAGSRKVPSRIPLRPHVASSAPRGERGAGRADGVKLAPGSGLGRSMEEPPSDRLIGRETQSDGGGGRRTISLRGLAAAYTPGSGAAELGWLSTRARRLQPREPPPPALPTAPQVSASWGPTTRKCPHARPAKQERKKSIFLFIFVQPPAQWEGKGEAEQPGGGGGARRGLGGPGGGGAEAALTVERSERRRAAPRRAGGRAERGGRSAARGARH